MCEEGLVGGKEGEEEMLDGREGWAERPEAELWMQHVYNKKGADVTSLVRPS